MSYIRRYWALFLFYLTWDIGGVFGTVLLADRSWFSILASIYTTVLWYYGTKMVATSKVPLMVVVVASVIATAIPLWILAY